MADELPDLSKFDKYLDDEDLEKLEGSKKGSASGGKGSAMTGTTGGGGSRGSGPRRWLWLLVGVGLGVAGTIFLPDLLRPHLPPALRLGQEEVAGLVMEKRMEGERLLLTVDTERGASLVTFTRRIPEIDLLVSVGDSVTLGLGSYAPLVQDPTLAGVRKGRAGRPGKGTGRSPASVRDTSASDPDAAVTGRDTSALDPDTATPAVDTAAVPTAPPDTAHR
ncbi:MAG TPA: hypothetical protein VLL48_01840 [Longimicrobiales bacterium]|nr:hypothetical protein [Longimicrobiales bacterium]